jgi:hypothetical protein
MIKMIRIWRLDSTQYRQGNTTGIIYPLSPAVMVGARHNLSKEQYDYLKLKSRQSE